MSLDTAPDIFDDVTRHAALDHLVNEELRRLKMSEDASQPFWMAALLVSIVKHSDEKLDSQYHSIGDALTFIRKDAEKDGILTRELKDAWRLKSYQKIRNLEPLWSSATLSLSSRYDLAKPVAVSSKFSDPDLPTRYYGKFCTILQSWGTGKSRLVTELRRKGVIVVYMNLRQVDDGFPPRDAVPAQILTEDLHISRECYEARCCAFFAAIFGVLQSNLSEFLEDTHMNVAAAVCHWNERMCDTKSQVRHAFFRRVRLEYDKVFSDIAMKILYRDSEPLPTGAYMDIPELKFFGLRRLLGAGRVLVGDVYMTGAYKRIISALPQIFLHGAAVNQPKLVIAFDDSHPLCIKNRFQPSHILCKAISAYSYIPHSYHSIWVVFVSTTTRVADFVAPQSFSNSARVSEPGKLSFPPYTALGWDQNAPNFQSLSSEETAKLDRVICFGRPLFSSLRRAGYNVLHLAHLAGQKLCGNKAFDPSSVDQMLAVLGQRFGLEISFGHPESVERIERGVTSHMRICIATTEDRAWSFTTYSSEPFLSCIAASTLHGGKYMLRDGLYTLQRRTYSGMVSIGQVGELASRLLFLLAKGLFVRAMFGKDLFVGFQSENDWDVELVDCKAVPLIKYLNFLFGERSWPPEALVAFKDAYVNFSHWVAMEGNIATLGDPKQISANGWTQRHWHRTSALQCCHGQPAVDKVIPIYFKPQTGSSSPGQVSQIFISDKAQKKSNKFQLNFISRKNLMIDCTSTCPYIAILVDFGRPNHAFDAHWATAGEDAPSLRIYAAGTNTTTFPFLKDHPYVVEVLRHLISSGKISHSSSDRSGFAG
ncbi:hypothetical protein J3A83DRAFT_4372409 [Scleroderma citrinum]